MRTTITLDDGLAADVKRRARAEGKSVSAVIAEALRAQLTRREAPSRTAPFRLITVKGGGLRPGVEVTRLRTIEETMDLERWKRRRR
jgi:plasmid stability protein